MYFTIVMFASIMSFAATAKLVLDTSALEQENSGLFFDAHNHTGGVLPPLGVINAEKFIYGHKIELDDLKNFWTAFINADVVKNKVLTNSLFSSGIKMFISCNEPLRFCSQLQSTEQCEQKLLTGIDHLLTSTPLTSFSTAYGIRRNLIDIPNLPGRTSSTMRAHALLFELAKTKVDVVEMSRPSIGGYGKDGSTWDFERYAKLTEDLRSDNPTAANKTFKNRLNELGYSVPRIKWLLMTHTTELGSVGDKETASYATHGQCTLMPLAESLKTDPETGLYSVLVNFPDVVGVDVAGPESTCFTKDGMNKFKNLAETTYFASIAKKREKNNQGKLVVRAHVGEGYPLNKEPFFPDELKACNAIQYFPVVEQVFDRTTNVPIHRLEAQKNIALILNAINDLKKQYSDIDDYVVFRLAHVTHIDDALAKKAKDLAITADVNLSSNIATGAWAIRSDIMEDYLQGKNVSPKDTSDILAALLKNGALLGDIFDNHGLKWLLKNQVPVMLGSDGSGVEHSESMRKEYLMAKELIEYWNEHDPEFARIKISIDGLLQYQKNHYDIMGY